MMGEASRRSVICGALAASVPAAPLAATVLDGVSRDERAFLKLWPTLLPLAKRYRKARDESDRLYAEADDVAGPHPGWDHPAEAHAWIDRATERRKVNGYADAWPRMNRLAEQITPHTDPFIGVPMQSMEAIMLKALLSDVDDLLVEDLIGDLRRAAEARLCA